MFATVLTTSFPPYSLRSSQVKLVLYPGFSNTLFETLRTHKFLLMVFIAGEIKLTILKVCKIKSRNAMLGEPRRLEVLQRLGSSLKTAAFIIA